MILVSYWPAFFAGFVWDDKVFQEAEPIQTLSGLIEIWFNPGSIQLEAHYWPMVFTTFWLEHRLWGYNPLGFHITNVVLHGIVTLLLWRLLLRLKVPGAWLIAALFALHPAHVEAVAWTMGRKDLLATLFYLLAASCWLRFQERQQASTYIVMLALFAAGMFSKSFVITLPAVLLLWVWWKQGRIAAHDLLQLAPLFLVGILIAAGDLAFYSSRAEIDFHFSFLERLIIASKALWFYVGTLLWPHPLPVIYPLWDTSPANPLNWLGLPMALALALALWLARHRIGRGALAGALFYAITLSPMLGFANNSYMEYSFAADRYLYLPIAGLLAVLVAAATLACQKFPPWALHGARLIVVLPLLIVCGALTWQQAQVYHDGVTLWRHVVGINPVAHRANYNLGLALVEQERLDEAVEVFMIALQQEPDEPKNKQALAHTASLYFNAEDYENALKLYRHGALIDPDNAEAHSNLGSALGQIGQLQEAIKSYERALQLDPQLDIALTNIKLARQMISKNKSEPQ